MFQFIHVSHAAFERLFLIFSVYAFAGWLMETPYRSITQKHFVNAGFLRGPFLPIYGLGALFVLALDPLLNLQSQPYWLQFTAYFIILTAIEYAVGTVCMRMFGLMLWDYSRDFLNIKGRVCLLFSLLWAALAFGFRQLIHPHVATAVSSLPGSVRHPLVILLVIFITLDALSSTALLRDLIMRLSRIHRHQRSGPIDIKPFLQNFQRLFSAFPNLRDYLDVTFHQALRDRIDERLSAMHLRFFRFLESRAPRNEEFRSLVRDIMRHPEVQRLRTFHHHDGSILHHSLRVAILSYRIGKYLKLDYRAIARAGLLHDFFLYDWRHHDLPELAKEKFHGLEHPKIALANAERYFELSDLERDIIVKHMWPLTWRPPRYRESMVVTCMDKLAATREFWNEHKAKRAAN